MNRFLALALFPFFLFGQVNKSTPFENYFQAFLTANEFSGAILVVKDDKVVFKRFPGFADLEKKIPNTEDTRFRIASCGKQFTAIAILQLQEQGKLSVSDKLNKYFPKIAKSDSITIDMLLTHRAGIHNYNDDNFYENLNNPSLTQNKVMEIIETNPSDFSPGSKFQYSNGGYFILGAIIEKVSNQSFDQFITDNIFKKIKMNASGIDHNDTTISNKAKGYVNNKNKLIPAPYVNMEGTMGCGNLYSTVNDLNKYYIALRDTVLLTAKSRRQFLTPAKEKYAYGISIDTLEKHALVTHGGWLYGFKSDITMYLNDNAFFVVLSNSESNVYGLSRGLQAILFNIPVIYPYKYNELKANPKSFEKFVGQYGEIRIFLKDNNLYINDISGPEGEIKLIPETSNKFFYAEENDRQIEFLLDKNRNVIKAWLIDGGIKHELKMP